MSWLNPLPEEASIQVPRIIPKVSIPSYLRDYGQVMNLLLHHGAGLVARDYSGYGNNGIIGALASWFDGPFGWCLYYPDVVGVKLRVPDSASLNVGAAYTIEFWVRVPDYPPVADLPRMAYRGAAWLWNIGVAGQNAIINPWDVYKELFFTTFAGGWRNTGYVFDTNWHLLHQTYDGANIRIYVDNIIRFTEAQAGNMPLGDFYFGSTHGGGSQLWGYETLIKFYNRVLTVDERTRHYELMRPIFGV